MSKAAAVAAGKPGRAGFANGVLIFPSRLNHPTGTVPTNIEAG